jgi:hypothetical protein
MICIPTRSASEEPRWRVLKLRFCCPPYYKFLKTIGSFTRLLAKMANEIGKMVTNMAARKVQTPRNSRTRPRWPPCVNVRQNLAPWPYAKPCVYCQWHWGEFRQNSATFSKNAIGCHAFGRQPCEYVHQRATVSSPPGSKSWQTGKLNFFLVLTNYLPSFCSEK